MEPQAQAPMVEDARPAAGMAGIFLHSGWRSCGTWMWERLRENPEIRGFYEPLHEDLATLRPRDIGLLRPDSWKSGHGTGAPYFMEYAPFLQARRGGVRGHDSRFAFEHYFAGPSTHDHALESYLRSLMRSAAGDKRIPVMKFCRSLGRVAWMQAHFPDVLHAVILRNPEAQWRSARRQMEHNKNRYFVLAPFIILARNARHPLLAEAADRLEVRMPPRLSGDLGITTAACWRHVQLLDWRQRFRGFLALWLASGMAALDSSALVIDADRLGAEPQHRRMAERAIGEAAGLSADFTPNAQDDGAAPGTASEQQDAACAKAAAFDMLRGHAGMLAPERAAVLATKLSAEGAVTPEAPGRQPARAHQPGVLRHVDAAAYVTLARASYPLRRAHYHVRRWLSLA